MTITLNGTTGIQNVLGSASAPADSNTTTPTTGIYYPTATTWGVATAGVNAMTVSTGQNVGIGTTSPIAKLDVVGDTLLAHQNSGNLLVRNLTGESCLDSYNDPITANYPLRFLGSYIRFLTSDAERMRIDSSGNFLVGTTSSPNGGNVKSAIFSSAANWTLWLQQSNAAPYGMYIKYTTTPNNGTYSFLNFGDGTADRFYVTSNGGIGNYSANNTNLSDQRVKKDIQLAGTYLNKICAIPVKTFLYNDQTDEELNLGVIAQDVEAIAPELVDASGFGETPEDGIPMKAIYQTDLQYALMKCIQELSAKNDALATQVIELSAKVAVLEQKGV